MKKILFNTEATYMATGYSRYGYELIRRIHDSGRFEVAELASYGVSKEEALKQGDERPSRIPWKYYPVVPNGDDQDGQREFHSDPFNQFGKWRWEHTCLDFKCDIAVAWRDNWYDNYMVYSPFRDFYNLIWMPTCDSYPQKAEWISDCSQLDACLAYTEWGKKVLRKQSNGKINLIGVAPPCADYNTFVQIHNKRELKGSIGLNPQSIIIGTTMRNQKRKLYPNLFRAFAEFLKGPKELTEEVYLYCHTYWPDIGWDMPTLLKDLGISRRVLFTYVCKDTSCNAVFQSLFSDLRCVCQKCGKNSATLPNSNQGVSVKDLVVIYNLFDIYVQYSNCLTPGQKIKTIFGWENIEDIKEGELVYTHKGNYRKVLKTFVNDVDKNVRKIKVYGDVESLEVTNEHPVYGVFKKNFGKCYRTLRESIGSQSKEFKLDFVKAEDIQKGDLLAYRINDFTLDASRIDLGDYIGDNDSKDNEKVIIKKGKTYNRYIDVDNDFCKFIGLFIADGNESKGNIRITCSLLEDNNVSLSELILNRINAYSNKRSYKERKALDVMSNSKPFANYLRRNCYDNKSKRIPDLFLQLPHEKQMNLLQGLFMGDGHYRKNRNVSIYVTTSYELSEQIKFLLHRLRINYNLRLVRRTNKKDGYRFEVYGDFKTGNISKVKHNSKSLYYENYVLKQVKSIEDSNYIGKVYNIEVEEDNSYTTKIANVHNCEGYGIPIIEAAACGIPTMVVDYSGMEDFKDTINAVPIKYSSLEMESETGTYKAIPDDKDFIEKLTTLIKMPDMVRRNLGYKNKLLAMNNYTWDKTAKVWMDYFDSVQTNNRWNLPPRLHNPNFNFPEGLSNDNFVKFALSNILGKPEYIKTYLYFKYLRNLNWEHSISNYGGTHIEDSLFGERPNFKPYNRQDLINELTKMLEFNNKWEQERIRRLS